MNTAIERTTMITPSLRFEVPASSCAAAGGVEAGGVAAGSVGAACPVMPWPAE